jgi:hypothetical protein
VSPRLRLALAGTGLVLGFACLVLSAKALIQGEFGSAALGLFIAATAFLNVRWVRPKSS